MAKFIVKFINKDDLLDWIIELNTYYGTSVYIVTDGTIEFKDLTKKSFNEIKKIWDIYYENMLQEWHKEEVFR